MSIASSDLYSLSDCMTLALHAGFLEYFRSCKLTQFSCVNRTKLCACILTQKPFILAVLRGEIAQAGFTEILTFGLVRNAMECVSSGAWSKKIPNHLKVWLYLIACMLVCLCVHYKSLACLGKSRPFCASSDYPRAAHAIALWAWTLCDMDFLLVAFLESFTPAVWGASWRINASPVYVGTKQAHIKIPCRNIFSSIQLFHTPCAPLGTTHTSTYKCMAVYTDECECVPANTSLPHVEKHCLIPWNIVNYNCQRACLLPHVHSYECGVQCSHVEAFGKMNRVDDGHTAVVLSNPKTADFEICRPSLLPGMQVCGRVSACLCVCVCVW